MKTPKETNYTPGPWASSDGTIYAATFGVDVHGKMFQQAISDDDYVCEVRNAWNREENSALIAAAPYMLAALCSAADDHLHLDACDKPQWLKDVEASIMAAKGGEA